PAAGAQAVDTPPMPGGITRPLRLERRRWRLMEDTDAELVAGVRRGDREAAASLAERYLRASRTVALSILHDVPAAEDVCQDAFVYAIERIADCRDGSRFGGWLLQIVRNRS